MGSTPTAGPVTERCRLKIRSAIKAVKRKTGRLPTRKQLDAAFPTIVRYSGLLLTIVLVGALILGADPLRVTPGFAAAATMVLYKTVRDAAENGNGTR